MTHYVVRGTIPKGTVWLMWDRGGGGWWQWTTQEGWAKVFNSFSHADNTAKQCKGPWYLVPKEFEVLEVDYTPAREASFKVKTTVIEHAETCPVRLELAGRCNCDFMSRLKKVVSP